MDQVENSGWLDELSGEYQHIFWVNHVGDEAEDKKIRSDYVNDHYLMFVVKLPTYTSHTDAAFVVNLKQSSMERLFQGSLGNGSLTVLDQDGKPVYWENPDVSSYYQAHPEKAGQMEETVIETGNGRYGAVKRKAEAHPLHKRQNKQYFYH